MLDMRAAGSNATSLPEPPPENIVRLLFANPDLVCRLIWYRPGYIQDLHIHDTAQISLLIAGALRETARGRDQESDRPSVARKPEGARHSVEFGPNGAMILSWEVQGDALESEMSPARRDWNWQTSRKLYVLLGALADNVSVDAGQFTVAESLLWDLLALISEENDVPAPAIAPPLMARLKEQIRLAPASFSVTETARCAGIHRVHLARLFRRHVGSTLTAYRCRAMAAAALRHILDPEKSLAEAALDTGFADQSHMTRMLKTETGFTPGALRRTMLGDSIRL
jgi:AraC family transcriptional regulator